MKFKILDGGFLPTRAHFDDAGIDFRTPETFTLAPNGGAKVIDLKVAVQIPIGYFGKMESKSGLITQKGVTCAGGIVDSGFRGTIKVRMINNGDEPYTFEKGDKVVQMVLIPCGLFDIEPKEELDLSDSGRNESGWGSTGR